MASSHEKKKHKHHKHSHHKHKKHRHKHHKHKKEREAGTPEHKRPDQTNDGGELDDVLLEQALISKESLLLDAPSDGSDSTDAATGQVSCEGIKFVPATSHPVITDVHSATDSAVQTVATGAADTTHTVNKAQTDDSQSDEEKSPVKKEKSKRDSSQSPFKQTERRSRVKKQSSSQIHSSSDGTKQSLRSGSGSKSKRRSRSGSRSRRRSRSGSRSRKRSRSGSRPRKRSRSGSRLRRRSRSGSRSRRLSRSGSKSRRRSRSRSRARRKSRSRSRSRRRARNTSRRSRSRSRSSRRRKSRRYSKSSSPEKEKEIPSYPIPIIKTKADIIAEFTAFCRDLTDEREGVTVDVEQYHPFELTETKETTTTAAPVQQSTTVTPTQVALGISSGILDTRPVEMRFPVSSGLYHQNEMTPISQPEAAATPTMSVAEIISERALIQQRLLINPSDSNAAMLLQELDTKMDQWCRVQTVPGRYTGCKEVTPLDKSVHKSGIQAWAKKKMFYGLRPVTAGFGMKLMKKMGWREGEPLGKSREGYIEPIPVDVKTDRQGLVTEEDKVVNTVSSAAPTLPASENTPSCLQGKHPVSAVQELCSKKQWDPPSYEMVSETGPPHMKTYLYRVRVNNESYQPTCGTNNKKMAKAQAALSCLKALGLMSN